jgi:hypothetical protein
MKKAIYYIVFTVCISFAAFAQQDDKAATPPSNIMGLQMAFVTKRLALTNDEAQKFWPVYYSYKAELRKTRQGNKEDVLAMEENMLNVRKKYRTEFKKILNGDDRVNKALTVDRDFANVVKKELMQRRANNRPAAKQ